MMNVVVLLEYIIKNNSFLSQNSNAYKAVHNVNNNKNKK